VNHIRVPTPQRLPGPAAVAARGWFAAHRWLLARRASQFLFLALFLTGPLFGFWIAKGTLASSLTFDLLPLTDPLFLSQSLLARHWPETTALLGAGIVLAGYAATRGRLYCAWVCPINPIADVAQWARRRFGWKKSLRLERATRYWLLGGALLAALATGTVVWEQINPVTVLHRGLVFGGSAAFGAALAAAAAVFLFDLGIADRGWCGHLCPVGAFYGLIGSRGFLAVAAPRRQACDDCFDCFSVCPEPQVIGPALHAPEGAPSAIKDGDCTACGRCIDVCHKSVFAFSVGGQS
jgi:ferredoxin-type protein NapH